MQTNWTDAVIFANDLSQKANGFLAPFISVQRIQFDMIRIVTPVHTGIKNHLIEL